MSGSEGTVVPDDSDWGIARDTTDSTSDTVTSEKPRISDGLRMTGPGSDLRRTENTLFIKSVRTDWFWISFWTRIDVKIQIFLGTLPPPSYGICTIFDRNRESILTFTGACLAR